MNLKPLYGPYCGFTIYATGELLGAQMLVASNRSPRKPRRLRAAVLFFASVACFATALDGSALADGSGSVIGASAPIYKQPNTSSALWGKAPGGSALGLKCGVSSQSVKGPGGTTSLWHEIIWSGNQIGWVSDTYTKTGTASLAAGEVWCGSGHISRLSASNVFSRPSGSAGVLGSFAAGTNLTLYCGATGDNYSNGKSSSTLWHMVGYADQVGWVPDTNVITGVNALAPGETTCPSVPNVSPPPSDGGHSVSAAFAQVRDRNGGLFAVGGAVNDSHSWMAGSIQDFKNGSLGWNAIMRANGQAAALIRGGFWEWYRANNNQGMAKLGYPTTDEFSYRGGARQFFERGQLDWSNNQVSYTPVSHPELSNTDPIDGLSMSNNAGSRRSATEVIAYARSYIGKLNDPSGATTYTVNAKGEVVTYCLRTVRQFFNFGTPASGASGVWGSADAVWDSVGSWVAAKGLSSDVLPNGIRVRWPAAAFPTPPAGSVAVWSNTLGGHAALVVDGSGNVISIGGRWNSAKKQLDPIWQTPMSFYSNAKVGNWRYQGAIRWVG